MMHTSLKRAAFLQLLFVSVTLYSCTKDMQQQQVAKPEAVIINAVTADSPGRTLAANCFQCHGTNGHAQEMGLAGESASEIISEMNEMKNGNPGANIMNVHARAYTDQEIKLIADFFSKQ